MTDYIKQVAEAVRYAVLNNVKVKAEPNQFFPSMMQYSVSAEPTDLAAIIASVPKPDPSIWMRPDELRKVKVSPYLCHGWNERDKQSDAIPLYTYPPDAQAEIDRLKSENTEMARLLSTRVEAVRLDEKQDEIDRLKAELETLRASRHYELVQAAGIARNEDLEDEQVAYMVEKERENADRRRDVYP